MTPGAEGAYRPIRILFVCTGNSARSQIAEALMVRIGGPDFAVESAGTQPRAVHPLAIRVLAEIGIDWLAAVSKSVTDFGDDSFDYVITVCDRARRPARCSPDRTSRSIGDWSTRPRSRAPTPRS
jgi:ArsR family transcriptional regulator, arsenate/arsenite/antimonite-responsive transcriptional repressor / arsenate reductase (thioredoxin)